MRASYNINCPSPKSTDDLDRPASRAWVRHNLDCPLNRRAYPVKLRILLYIFHTDSEVREFPFPILPTRQPGEERLFILVNDGRSTTKPEPCIPSRGSAEFGWLNSYISHFPLASTMRFSHCRNILASLVSAIFPIFPLPVAPRPIITTRRPCLSESVYKEIGSMSVTGLYSSIIAISSRARKNSIKRALSP